jgi:hypothetical protein
VITAAVSSTEVTEELLSYFVEFATQLVNDESGPLEQVVNIFISQNMIQPATSFLLDTLKEGRGRL